MVKIRAFISKKAVPRGIDIDNKEYWQPFSITVKGKDDEGNDGGNDEGGDGGDTSNKYCTINIVTIPENATIVATDEDGNVYRNKTFQIIKGKQVTIIATPDAPSTGYKPTTKILTSTETNQDNLNYNFILDSDIPVEETTTINIVSNIAGVLTYVYTSDGLLLNSDGSNTIQNVLVGSVIKVKPVKEGYKLKTSSVGTINTEDGNDVIIGINVTKNLLINLSFESVSDEVPIIKGVENDYSAFYEAQEFVRTFKATFYKIRIYGDLAVSLVTSWAQSVNDANGGQSITDVEESHHGEQDISFKLNLSENNTSFKRNYNFTIIAENKSGQQVSKSFQIVQQAENVQIYKVKIVTKVNNVITGNSDIIRKIDGESVIANEEKDVPSGETVTFYAKYLGKEIVQDVVITDNYDWEVNFEVVNISLGTVKDENDESFNTWKLNLVVPVLGINIDNWKTELIPVIKGTEYVVTGRDTSGQRADYNSGVQIANGYQLNVVFKGVPTYNVIVRPVDENDNDIIGASVTLKVGVVNYNNGSSFTSGTKVGYVIEADGYEIASLSDGSALAIIAGVTQNPVKVTLTRIVQNVNVVIRTTLNGQLATDAQIFIENQYKGTGSPFTVENLVNGNSYNYRVELDGQLPTAGVFTAGSNLIVDVEYSAAPSKYLLGVTMLNPSDAKIEVNDYTDGQLYVAYGELYQQIGAGHRITIKYSKDGYATKYMPHGAGDLTPGDENGTILMDGNKSYLNLTLDPFAPISSYTYKLNVNPSDAKVEFYTSGQYEEYPNKTIYVQAGSTVRWRVSKQGYVTQEGESNVISGNTEDSVTLVQEQPNVNNNVLFSIRSIKDKDTNEDIDPSTVTVKLQLKGVNQEDNKTITQADINEAVDNLSSEWGVEIGRFGGVAEKGTDVKLLITKEGYDYYNRWGNNYPNFTSVINIESNYEGNVLHLDVIMQTPKCSFVLYPIQNISEEEIVPDAVYIREGNALFTEADRINLVGNRYRKEVNRGANVYYLVLKNGYYGGNGHVDNVNFSQSKAVTMGAAPQVDTVEVTLLGNFRHRGAIIDSMTNQGGMTIYDAPVPMGYSLTSYRSCPSSYVGSNNAYQYKFVVPKNELILFTTTYNNRIVSCIGSFNKNTNILMNVENEPIYTLNNETVNSPNLYVYNMVEGDISYNTDNEFDFSVRDILNVNVPNNRGLSQDHALRYYINEEVEGLHIEAELNTTPSPINTIEENIPFGNMLTLYCNFVYAYINIAIDGQITKVDLNNPQKEIYSRFDYTGETKNITIESNDNWTIE